MSRYPRNAVVCLLCGEMVESRHVHDFRTCPCGSVSVDGGYEYLRRLWKPDAPGWREDSVREQEDGTVERIVEPHAKPGLPVLLPHPGKAGPFAIRGLLDPWIEGPRWNAFYATFPACLLAIFNEAENNFLASIRVETDGIGVLIHTIESHRTKNSLGGVWIHLLDREHKRAGPIRECWIAHRHQLLADGCDVTEIDLLRVGHTLHERTPHAAWSYGCYRGSDAPQVTCGGVRSPLQTLETRFGSIDLAAVMARCALYLNLTDAIVDYDQELTTVSDQEGLWAQLVLQRWKNGKP